MKNTEFEIGKPLPKKLVKKLCKKTDKEKVKILWKTTFLIYPQK